MPAADRRLRLYALAATLTVAITLIDTRLLGTPFGAYFASVIGNTGWIGVGPRLGGVIAIGLAQTVFFVAALRSPWPWRVLALLLFTAFTLFEYGWVLATGTVPTEHDLRTILPYRAYWAPEAQMYFTAIAFVPVAVFAATLVANRPPGAGDHRRWWLAAAIAVIGVHSVYGASAVIADWRVDDEKDVFVVPAAPSTAMMSFAHAATIAGWTGAADLAAQHHRPPRTAVAPVPPPPARRHVVLVIDESVRADRLSLNGYARKIAPMLDAVAAGGQLINWGVAASLRNSSAGAVACLLTGVSELPDRDRRTERDPTIFQYAKALGYQTHLLDGGTGYRRFGFDAGDDAFIDDWRNQRDFGSDPDTDMRLAVTTRELLRAPAPQFVLMLKRGNHGPYEGNVPAGHSRFRAEAGETAPSLAYDEGLAYNLDVFFRELLAGGIPENTAILYTSDHGQWLPSGGPEKWMDETHPRWELFAVPMMLLTRQPIQADIRVRASHAHVFATTLDLLGYPEGARAVRYPVSLLRATTGDEGRRYVYEGAFFGHGPFARYDFDELRGR